MDWVSGTFYVLLFYYFLNISLTHVYKYIKKPDLRVRLCFRIGLEMLKRIVPKVELF